MGNKRKLSLYQDALEGGRLINRACAKLIIRPGSGSERWGFPNRAGQRIRKKNLAVLAKAKKVEKIAAGKDTPVKRAASVMAVVTATTFCLCGDGG